MDIMFLNPPTKDNKKYIREGRCMQLTSSWAAIWPPLSLAILAQISRELGHNPEIFDANVQELEFDKIESILDNIDILVLNTSFPSIDSDLEVAKKVKKYNKNIIVISFGVFFTLLEEEGMPKDKSIDYVIYGEPEETFKELLKSIENNTNKEKIDGLMFLNSDGYVFKSKRRDLISSLDSIPVPDRSLLKNERYILPQNGEAFTLVNTSRGCPFPCTFCIVKAYYGKKIRRHSIKYILDEICECVEKYQLKNFLLWEETFTFNNDVVIEFCNGLKERKLNIKWAITTRADSLDIDSLKLMKETGCFLIGMGIESCSQKILDKSRKQEKIEDIIQSIKLCNKIGLPVMGHFIFGLPGETKETARNTIKLMNNIGLTYMQSYCAVPYPKTEFGEMSSKNGWIIREGNWSEYDFGGKSIVNIPTLSAIEVTKFKQKAFRSFYIRPRKIFDELCKFRTIRDFFQALSFLRWIK